MSTLTFYRVKDHKTLQLSHGKYKQPKNHSYTPHLLRQQILKFPQNYRNQHQENQFWIRKESTLFPLACTKIFLLCIFLYCDQMMLKDEIA